MSAESGNGKKNREKKEVFGFELEKRVTSACQKQLQRLAPAARLRVMQYLAQLAQEDIGGQIRAQVEKERAHLTMQNHLGAQQIAGTNDPFGLAR